MGSSTDGPSPKGEQGYEIRMTKPPPVCKQQLTKKVPTETVPCACGRRIRGLPLDLRDLIGDAD